MSQQENLHRLIKSMNKVEKSYFKKQSKVHGKTNNNYVLLFNEFAKMDEFDEEKLNKEIKKHNFHHQISRINNYLNYQILKSLRLYHSENSIADKIEIQIKNIKILFNKGLFLQSRNKLDKIKGMAYQYELWGLVLELLKIERRLISKEAKKNEQENYLLKSFEERKRVIEIQENSYEYEYFYDQAIVLIKEKQKATSPELVQKYQEILKQELFKDPKNAMSHQALILYYFVTSGYYFFTNQMSKTYELVKKRMEVIESKPHFIKEDPNTYINVLSNLLTLHNVTICSKMNLMTKSEFDNHIGKLRYIKVDSIELETKILVIEVVHQIGYYINNGMFEECLEYINSRDSIIREHENYISPVNYAVYNYLLSYVYLGVGEYKKSLSHINILLSSKIKLREDVQSFARILNIIIHFELQNFLHLVYTNKSTYQYLLRKDRLFSFEKLILKHMSKIDYSTSVNNKNIDDNLLKLRKELVKFLSDNALVSNDEIFHFICWIDSKIHKISLGEAIKNNLSK